MINVSGKICFPLAINILLERPLVRSLNSKLDSESFDSIYLLFSYGL